MPNLLPTSDFEQKRILTGMVAAGIIFSFFGALPIVVIIAALLLKIKFDKESDNKLISRAIEAQDSSDFLELERKQITLSETQKLTMLINAHQLGNKVLINILYEQNFTIAFSTICGVFRKNQQVKLFILLIERFLNKSSGPSKQELDSILIFLCNSKNFYPLNTLLMLYPELVLILFFEFIVQNNNNSEAMAFLNQRKMWLIENSHIVNNALRYGAIIYHWEPGNYHSKEQLLYFLIDIFPNGELDVSYNLMELIVKQIDNLPLYNTLLNYFNKNEKNQKFHSQLEQIIERALSGDKFDIAERLFKDNPGFLVTRKEFAAKLVFQFPPESKVFELLLRYGASINITHQNGESWLESHIKSRYLPASRKQRQLDIYTQNGGDLSLKLKDAPENRTDMSLLSYLSFLNVKVKQNNAFDAIRLQKFIALFLEIPGISISNGTICKHTSMQDPQAYWNFLLDLYFKLNKTNSLNHLPSSVLGELNNCLSSLYSENGDYNPETLFENYKQGKPVILPIYIHDGFGGLHIAVSGFIKTGPNSHLVVEADRGMGRHDFSVFESQSFNVKEFYRHTQTCYNPILVYTWESHKTEALLSINLAPQKDSFCPSISAKFAFNITVFLCLIRQRINENSQFNNDLLIKKEILTTGYGMAALWMKEFGDLALNTMLFDYRSLQAQFIDNKFLNLVEEVIATNNATASLI